jgi:outer membrane protein TolC
MSKGSRDDQTKETSSPVSVRQAQAAGEPIPDFGSDRGTGSSGFSDGNNPIGASGENWERKFTILLTSFSGGILNRLMQQAQDQLENANACIEWYEREKQRAEQAIDELSALQTQLHSGEDSE